MKSILILIVVAIIVEGLTEYIKASFPKISDNTQVIFFVTVALGIGIALLTGADVFSVIGIETRVPYIGEILTGCLTARGSNYMFDLMARISNAKKQDIATYMAEPEIGGEKEPDEGVM